MQDDLLDVERQTAETGKPRGLDLRDGNPSMPIVLALAADAELQRIFASISPTPADVEAGLAAILRSGVCERVLTHAHDELQTAQACLDQLAPSDARAALEALTRGLSTRVA
jgi:geranylgeranyl pyrophosphate synthase